jgi:two-component system cell cycle response regulator
MDKKILVVDDNSNNVRLLKDILEDEYYSVYTTDSGYSVLEMARNLKPDVILLDIMMPGMDGFEVCQLLKSDYEVMDIPVIMVTAKTEGNDLKNAFEIGAVDYIKKPFDDLEVVARINSVLRTKQNQDKLKEMANRDGLTGIYNHALLIELFEKEMKKQERNGDDLSFIMLDIDHFKKVNDTYGHTVGDLVLKDLARILSNSIRDSDFVGRYGGEEFSIVLTNANEINTYEMCERIKSKIQHHQFYADELSIQVTVSMGYYCKTLSDPISSFDMIKRADEALYKAKKNGRNRVEKGIA